MKKNLVLLLCSMFLPSLASAAMNGQIINCPSPNPIYPTACVDDWALDLLDESKTAIQAAKAAGSQLPRDRKHYFDGDGTGVHIFILDTGVYEANPEFKKLDAPTVSRIGTKFNLFTNDRDAGSHGTRVAGIAAGVKFGIAKDATLHPINSNADIGLGEFDGPALLRRLEWVEEQVDGGATPAVLNMSFNLSVVNLNATEQANRVLLTAQVQRLIDVYNVVVVASAGNKNDSPANYWPSEMPSVIVVGGVDDYGRRWIRDEEPNLCTTFGDCGSNYGAVDLWAPARRIRSAIDPNFNTSPLIRSGTSYSAPMVTGLAALYLEANPTATPATVLSALQANAANLGNIDGDGDVDYLVRSPVATPACNVPQRLFTNMNTYVKFSTVDLQDSCPSGTTASSPTMPAHGQLSIAGIAPEGISYLYTPTTSYTGTDTFNYTITPSSYGTGTVKVVVQPAVN